MKVPYPMLAAVDPMTRNAQVAVALHYARLAQYPRLEPVPIADGRSMSIACYGPSLADTYRDLTRPILSMSGATRWLADRGVVPDFHLDMDPREHKVHFIDPPVPGVHYLMASVCHPKTWDLLRGQRVTVWHTYSAPDTYDVVAALDRNALVIRGGSTVGLTALHIGGVLGYRHYEVHGMDGSFVDDARSARHCGPHPGTKQQDGITWAAGGVTYQTSRIMANAVTETISALANYPIFCVFHGRGLTQALIREQHLPNACCADEREKAARLRGATVHILDPILLKDGDPVTTTAWDQLCAPLTPDLRLEMEAIAAANEPRRRRAKYNTGTITIEQMCQLRALCAKQQPTTIVEIGTFIGNSAMAMRGQRIFTCDRDNDCVPRGGPIVPFPYTKSTRMLTHLASKGFRADLFFFDGRIDKDRDLDLIARLSHPGTIYVFDDYIDTQKGVINAKLVAATLALDGWTLVEPDPRLEGKSTLAALVPRALLHDDQVGASA